MYKIVFRIEINVDPDQRNSLIRNLHIFGHVLHEQQDHSLK